MGFRSTLESTPVGLSESEQRIGRILLAASYDAVMLTGAQVAERADVHESTVVRFAQKLGYTGYPALRADLLRDVQETRVARVDRIRRKTEVYQLQAIVDSQIATLHEIPEHISQDALDAASEVITAAPRVYIFGYGFMTPAVDFMERKLRHLSLNVVPITHDGTELTERISTIRSEDALIVFAFSEQYRTVAGQLLAQPVRQEKTVLITDQSSLMARPLPKHTLALPSGHEHRAVMAAIMVVCYAISNACRQATSNVPPLQDEPLLHAIGDGRAPLPPPE